MDELLFLELAKRHLAETDQTWWGNQGSTQNEEPKESKEWDRPDQNFGC